MTRLAILAGHGSLPQQIAAANPDALFVEFDALPVLRPSNQRLQASFERLGSLFTGLHAAGVTHVVFAGGLARPNLDPSKFDAEMRNLAPRFMSAMQGGDDGLLRSVIGAFEDKGFEVCGAHEVMSDLTVGAGHIAGPLPDLPSFFDFAARARRILLALSVEDVGQGAVAAQGRILGIETVQGTDAMLDFVAATDPQLHPGGGVLYKGPKLGQDLRIDLPAIGPTTIRKVAQARLSGVAIAADRVLILERDQTLHLADELGVTFVALDD